MTLELLGYAESDGRQYHLTTRVLKLGFSYLSSASLPVVAQLVLERITERVHESSSLSVIDQDQIVYLARSPAKRVMSVGLSVGSRLPAYCTAMGWFLASVASARFAANGLPAPRREAPRVKLDYRQGRIDRDHSPRARGWFCPD